ncbi:MAG: hypothetical protein ACOC90_09935 [Bacteroidota bacterium]
MAEFKFDPEKIEKLNDTERLNDIPSVLNIGLIFDLIKLVFT